MSDQEEVPWVLSSRHCPRSSLFTAVSLSACKCYPFPDFASCLVHVTSRVAFCVSYHYNVWYGQNFPFLSQSLFNFDGSRFNQTSILDENFLLDRAKLADVGLPWFASSQVISKVGWNMAIGATVTHVLIWYGKEIVSVIKKHRAGEDYDPHLAKMKVYPEVPMWWYIAMFIGSFAMAMATLYTGGSGLPW